MSQKSFHRPFSTYTSPKSSPSNTLDNRFSKPSNPNPLLSFTTYLLGKTNKMDKPSTSGQPQKVSTGRRVRLIPATPRPEGTAIPTSPPPEIPNEGTSQPPETFGGNLYSRIIKEAMAKFNRVEIKEGKTNSLGNLGDAATLSDTQTTSSSSLRFSTDDDSKAEEGQGRKGTGRTFEEIASEVIRELREVEEREEIKEKQEMGEQLQTPAKAASREPQENPIREIYDLTGTDEEEAATSDGWRSRMEDTVNTLVAARVEQNALLRSQGEQLTRVVTLVDRVISWMGKESQASQQLSTAGSTANQNKPPQNTPDVNLAGTSRKRKPTTTTNQSFSGLPASSGAKRQKLEKRSGSHGSQKKN